MLALLATGLAGPPAGAGAPPPPEPVVVDIAIFLPSSTHLYRDCDDVVRPIPDPSGGLLARTGPLLSELTVTVEVIGTLAGEVEDPPTSVTFPVGRDQVPVILDFVGAPGPGTIGLRVLDGADYDLGPNSSATADVAAPEVGIDCDDPLADAPALGQPLRDDQTIHVGEVPVPIGLYEIPFVPGAPRSAMPRDLSQPTADTFDTPVVGALPPGLAYADDTWSGAATTPGTFTFAVRLCNDGELYQTTFPVCLGTADVRITVLGDGSAGPQATAATPVATTARFTG
ncbi:MAG TPA: hypothetical protein VEW93_02090 [Acidimicrobiales bacterium]|nr:hypothetical protein [Acidimicrobiales bacterium]